MKHIKTFESFSDAKSVEEATVYGNVKIADALDSAEEAFWNSIASSFPEIKTGDFGPTETSDFRKATNKALNTWLKNNS